VSVITSFVKNADWQDLRIGSLLRAKPRLAYHFASDAPGDGG